MPDYRSDNVSNAFQAFFESGANATFEKSSSYGFKSEDVVLEKYATAGMPVYNPTADNVENTVRKMSQVKFGKDLMISASDVAFKPTAYQGPHSDFVSEGTGIVKIIRGNYQIELPFLVHDSQILPFDVIQLNGERMPYSEENLAKLVMLCDKKNKEAEEAAQQGNPVGAGAPFVKPVDKMNSTTSTGFLGNTLSIQDRYRFPNYVGGTQYIVASDRLEECLEKLANMVSFDWNAVENAVLAKEKSKEMEKFAGDFDFGKKAEDNSIATTMNKVHNMKWRNAVDLPDKTYITFPEFKDGNELTMTDAIVVQSFALSGKINPEKKNFADFTTMVLTKDGRCRLFTKGQKMLCLVRETVPGKFKSVSFAELFDRRLVVNKYGDSVTPDTDFIMFYDDKLTMPFHITSRSNRTMSAKVKNDIVIKSCTVRTRTDSDNPYVTGRDERKATLRDNGLWSSTEYANVYLCDNVDRLCKVTDAELVELLKKSHGLTDVEANRCVTTDREYSYEKLFAVNPSQQVIPVTGILTTFFKDKKELDFILQNKKAVKDDMLFLKTAMDSESITIECQDEKAKKYSLTVSYTDRSKRMFASRIKKMNGIHIGDLRGILSAIGYPNNRVQELCYMAKSRGRVVAELPQNFDSDKISGTSKSTALMSFNNMRKKVFSNDIVKKVATETIATALTDTPVAKNQFVRDTVLGAQKKASEYKNLSCIFEKIAQDKKSDFYREVAKASAISSHLFEKTAEMIEEKAEYPQILSICEKIASSKEHLDILATDLILTKTASVVSEDKDINPNYLMGAVYGIESMYKLASCYLEKAAEAADKEDEEDSDKRPLSQKMKSEAVAKALKENEKLDTEGGKATPSKLVRRKNQQRMLR